MESKSPLDTLPPSLSQPLEDAANEKTDSTGMKVQEENDQPGVEVSPPTDEEASSDDDGPEDCVRTGKAKARGTRADPPPKKGSPKSKSPSQSEHRICPFCRQWPIVGPYEYCSEQCEKAAGIAKRKAVFRVLKPFDPKDRIAQAIYHKFCQEWNDPTGAQVEAPDVHAIYQISLPYYEDRFLDAIFKAQTRGGSNTKSAWFACQSICDVGVKSDDLCNTRACGICMAIKSGFDELAFGKTTNNGVYGDGIYAHQNPAVAHRFTVRKSEHNFRVVILCSIVELEPGAPVDNILDYGAHIDGDGRVFCAKKDVIIPRRLVVYSVAPPAEGSTMDLSTN